jgi:hypothetical protein
MMTGDEAVGRGAVQEIEAEVAAAAAKQQLQVPWQRAELVRAHGWLGDDPETFLLHSILVERAAEDESAQGAGSGLVHRLAAGHAARGDFNSLAAAAAYCRDAKDRVRILADVANDPAAPNAATARAAILRLIEQEARRAGEWRVESFALFHAVQVRLRGGDLSAAAETARRIPGLGYRANALRDVANAHSARGETAAAEQLKLEAKSASRQLPSVANSVNGIYTAIAAASEAAKAGDDASAAAALSAAEQEAAGESDPVRRAEAYLALAEGQAHLRRLDECRRLLGLAEAAEPQGDDDALPLVSRIPHLRADVARSIAGAGDLPWALRVADTLPERERESAYASIASRLATSGRIGDAKGLANRLRQSHHRRFVSRVLAREQASRGMCGELPPWVASLPTAAVRCDAMIGAAEGLSGKDFHEPL